MRHNLKIEKRWLDAVASGEKRAEIRKADRDFRSGDELLLYLPDESEAALVRITHVLRLDEIPGFRNDIAFVSLSIDSERLLTGDAVSIELKLGDCGR